MKLAIRFDACAACDEVLETGFWFCQFHQVFSRRLSETPEAFLFSNNRFKSPRFYILCITFFGKIKISLFSL